MRALWPVRSSTRFVTSKSDCDMAGTSSTRPHSTGQHEIHRLRDSHRSGHLPVVRRLQILTVDHNPNISQPKVAYQSSTGMYSLVVTSYTHLASHRSISLREFSVLILFLVFAVCIMHGSTELLFTSSSSSSVQRSMRVPLYIPLRSSYSDRITSYVILF
ncbi:unnamed protein product [Nippostrongylus brasiliensis]|uniref:Protein phosphatase 2C n=1 Tax=Nippostrongylus brasiliensis TaxID=27835 RepID=A0A0N4YK18_NIPBR|nr:unnamed protein product [Nippostrongylus brasiliensis]